MTRGEEIRGLTEFIPRTGNKSYWGNTGSRVIRVIRGGGGRPNQEIAVTIALPLKKAQKQRRKGSLPKNYGSEGRRGKGKMGG